MHVENFRVGCLLHLSIVKDQNCSNHNGCQLMRKNPFLVAGVAGVELGQNGGWDPLQHLLGEDPEKEVIS